MKNYIVTYVFDGYKFAEIVNAETADVAFEYLKWITESEQDLKFINAKETSEIASYFCPKGWVKPESLEMARLRSLFNALDAVGIEHNGYSVEYSEKLNNFMLSRGYYATCETEIDNVLGFVEEYIVYRKPYSHTLNVQV